MRVNEYQKKPVRVQAVQLDGFDRDQALDILSWINDLWPDSPQYDEQGPTPTIVSTIPDAETEPEVMREIPMTFRLRIPTAEGVMEAQPGDWIIRGVQGEFYPCKPDIFEQTYDAVDEGLALVEKLKASGRQPVSMTRGDGVRLSVGDQVITPSGVPAVVVGMDLTREFQDGNSILVRSRLDGDEWWIDPDALRKE